METQLKAICPLDGSYFSKVENLSKYFSDEAYIKYRINIGIKYFVFILAQLGIKAGREKIQKILNYNSNVMKVKEYEKETDVEAVEYYLRDVLDELEMSEYKEYINIGLTTEDINTSVNIKSIKNFLEKEYYPNLLKIITKLYKMAGEYRGIKMLSRTNGQPTTPTTMIREFLIYLERLNPQIEKLKSFKFKTKFGGQVGQLYSLYKTYPKNNWDAKMNTFVTFILGLKRIKHTTQIHNYIELSELFDNIKRINTILIDMCQDFWYYISLDYFTKKVEDNENSLFKNSYKINPIDFENTEGNLMLSNTMLEFFSRKLPISRLQRDLTDTVILKNLGVMFGYTMVGFKSLIEGLDKLEINKDKIKKDLENHPEVYMDTIETIMRKHKVENASQKIKKISERKNITLVGIKGWIKDSFSGDLREELLRLFQ